MSRRGARHTGAAITKFRLPNQGRWLLSCHHVIDGVARAAPVETTRFVLPVLAHLSSRYYTVIFACSTCPRSQRRVTVRAEFSERFLAQWTAIRMVAADFQEQVSVTASRRIAGPGQGRRLPSRRRTSSRLSALRVGAQIKTSRPCTRAELWPEIGARLCAKTA
jgi:hypothetical protein